MSLRDAILAAIEPVDANLFQLAATGPSVPAEADVAQFETDAGFGLPAEFRSVLMSDVGGLYVRATPESWPPVEAYDIAPSWKFWRGVALLGMATDIPQERLDIRFQLDEAQERGLKGFIPFLTIDGSASVWGFDAEGRIHVNDDDADLRLDDEQDVGALYTREIAALIQRQQDVAAGK